FEQAKHLLEAFLGKHGLVPTRLLRIKANLLVRSAVPGGPKPFPPHVDIPKPHWVMIYYVNDSDGDTLIFDKNYPDWANATVVHAVGRKRGRAIFFDGRHYHCGTIPAQNDVRVVLNYNFV